MTPLRNIVVPFLLGLVSAGGCYVDTAPNGLRETPSGPGAQVVYDPTRRPIPEVPLPNDVATFPDPTSRTGRRVNVSLHGKSFMERNARVGLSELEGWGTYMPIWAAFQRAAGVGADKPALDLDAIKSRMPKGDYEFPDDPVYVVNLKTGVPVVLDMGSGNFPSTIQHPFLYGENDVHGRESNVLLETREEGAGLTQADYRPELDTDFDGVIDHPNTYGSGTRKGYDDLLTWYERETDTLIMRPVIPLEEKTEYAVVFTDRLVGSDGHSIKSPFEFVHHPQQRASVTRLRDVLEDGSRANYYGDIAGTFSIAWPSRGPSPCSPRKKICCSSATVCTDRAPSRASPPSSLPRSTCRALPARCSWRPSRPRVGRTTRSARSD